MAGALAGGRMPRALCAGGRKVGSGERQPEG